DADLTGVDLSNTQLMDADLTGAYPAASLITLRGGLDRAQTEGK
ncbi:MAG: pentapeptide repeat-containing protein, partial [Candidatus Methylomirabilales bacterium]